MWRSVPALVGLACVLPPAHQASSALARLGVPAVSTLMLGGLLAGPEGLGLLRPADGAVRALSSAALAVLIFAAGAELRAEELVANGRQLAGATLGVSLGSWVASFLAALWVLPGLRWVPQARTRAVASLVAIVSLARSPASAIAVVREAGAAGPFTTLALATIVAKDVLLFVGFSITVEAVASSDGSISSAAALRRVLLSLVKVLWSLCLGAAPGLALGATAAFLGGGGRRQRGRPAAAAAPTSRTRDAAWRSLAAARRAWDRAAVAARRAAERALAALARGSGDGGGAAEAPRDPSGGLAATLRRLAAQLRLPTPPSARTLPILAAASAAFFSAEALGAEPLLATVAAGAAAVALDDALRARARAGTGAGAGPPGGGDGAAAFASGAAVGGGGDASPRHGGGPSGGHVGHPGGAIPLDPGATSSLATWANLVFFCCTGARVRVWPMLRVADAALALALARAAGIWVGSLAGLAAAARAAGAPRQPYAPHFWQAMLTQAGIALGLVHGAAGRIGPWGDEWATLQTAIVIVNLAVGPPLFRAALVAVGEAGRAATRAEGAPAEPELELGLPADPAERAHLPGPPEHRLHLGAPALAGGGRGSSPDLPFGFGTAAVAPREAKLELGLVGPAPTPTPDLARHPPSSSPT